MIKNKLFWSRLRYTKRPYVVHLLCITMLSLFFAKFIVYDLMSLPVFAPIEKATDFQMSDIYQSVENSRAVHQLSKNITIVSIDGINRVEVLDVINVISEYNPSAIGIDVFFNTPGEDNSYLLSTIKDVPNLICAGSLKKDFDGSTYHHDKQSFYEDSIEVTYGYVNLKASSPNDVIRQFFPFVLSSTGDTLLSFPAQIANVGCHKSYNTLIARQNKSETIVFENIEFPIVSVQEILNGEVEDSLLRDKIVLIGDTMNINDLYLTPLHGLLPGVMLHAYALQTILSGNYIESTSTGFNWTIAILLCLLLTIGNLVAKYYMGNVGNLFARILQFSLILVLIVIGYYHFYHHHDYIDFSAALLTIGFSAVAFDVWFGFYALYEYIKNKIIRK